MQRCIWLCCVGLLLSVALDAGQIYGSLTSGGKAVPHAGISINCGGAVTTAVTAADGSYRMSVPQQGRCTLEVSFQGRPSAAVFSFPNPTQYDFDLVHRQDGNYEIRRR